MNETEYNLGSTDRPLTQIPLLSQIPDILTLCEKKLNEIYGIHDENKCFEGLDHTLGVFHVIAIAITDKLHHKMYTKKGVTFKQDISPTSNEILQLASVILSIDKEKTEIANLLILGNNHIGTRDRMIQFIKTLREAYNLAL